MSALDTYLAMTQPQPAPNATTTAASSNGLPDWYNQYVQGIAGQATAAGQAASQVSAPQYSVAGFTPAQEQAFTQVQGNQGAWRPYTDAATGQYGAAQGAAPAANAAVAGPAAKWTDPGTAASYMSPYTDSVVSEIGRLGNQNFNENIMPQINGSMIGAGQFGSERNADVLGRAGRDAEQNILGQQSSALQAGYGTAGALFGADAARQQQQQQTQASTALAGGALQGQLGQQYGALGSQVSGLGLGDAQAMQAVGQQQQTQQQNVLNTGTQNATANANWDWSNLNNMSSLVRGQQLPQTVTGAQSAPLSSTQYSPAPLSTLAGGVAGILGSA